MLLWMTMKNSAMALNIARIRKEVGLYTRQARRYHVALFGAAKGCRGAVAGVWTEQTFGTIKTVQELTVPVPEQALAALRLSPAEMTSELRLAAAAKLFELGRLSSGVAAELAGLPRVVFLSRLADYGVATFRLSEEELQKELERG